ncbi:MAG: UvrD-helicase domain-containing protein [Bacteroidaceae bacterium]|nr:UvrD-helicase domain-containing protein [Bacteroidaceae bacterium]
MANRLDIFKASAGSGKTFTLAVEYIKLLIDNPAEYRNILAVTFTNKATGEMKERILSTLSKLATKDAAAQSYLGCIKKDEAMAVYDDDTIARRCQTALTNILHDYSRFHIETIDSFFQSIVRNLAHELSLTANLRVDLDQKQVLSDAVRKIIEELQADGSALFLAVRSFIEDNIESNHNWKINDDVEKFGENIFKEVYLSSEKVLSQAVADPDFYENYKKELQTRKASMSEEIRNIAGRFFELCDEAGCNDVDLFFHKSQGPYGYMLKLKNGELASPNSYVSKCIGNPSAISKDKTVGSHAGEFAGLLENAAKTVEENATFINSADLVLKHINKMRLLSAVDQKVRQLNHEASRFLLADTAHFLNEMISGSDIPFIYEKAGSVFKHIMIDEFQDTSSLQWNNFKPLLRNCLDAGHSCLIVGDVKQSIYRWRNAEWEILNNIERDQDFHESINRQEMDTNYRSAERIIKFNNILFSKILETVSSDDVRTAYADVKQNVPDNHIGDGYVHIDILPKEDYKAMTLSCIKATIDNLLGQGIRQQDITLLLRTNSQISSISTYLSENATDIRVVSDEAYRLDSSVAVNTIILALRTIANPDDRLTIMSLLVTRGCKEPYLFTDSEIEAHLPSGFYGNLDRLALIPLVELCHMIYGMFGLSEAKGQDAYLMCFHDRLNEYAADSSIDLPSFLRWWDESLCSVNIPAGSIDGIRAMTIHKSKGLEFHTVICPFCDWSTKGKAENLIWCKPTEEPFSRLPLTAISHEKKALSSLFKADYEEEEKKCFVDSLNMLYVAFTRPRKNLFIITGDKGKGESVFQLINEAIPSLGEGDDAICMSESKPYCEGAASYDFGQLVSIVPEDDKTPDSRNITLPFISHDSKAEFRQSNKSRQFIGTADDEDSEDDRLRYINEGLAAHRFLELYQSNSRKNDIIEQLDKEGYFENDSYRKSIIRLTDRALANAKAMDWFAEKWTEYNEVTILTRDDDGNHVERRPDRVITDGKETIVIDYKTGRKSDSHHIQVRAYIDLLTQMGYPSVKGYLWYIRHNETIEVKPSNSPQIKRD